MIGFLDIQNASTEVLNNLLSLKKFIFKGDGITINGDIFGLRLFDRIDIKIKDVLEWIRYKDKEPNKLKILYNIPYVSLLSRKIKHYWGYDEDYIVKFDSNEFKICVQDFSITFYEYISLLNHIDPDSIFNKRLYPKIEFELENSDTEYIKEKLKYLEDMMLDVMVIISFILFKRLNMFGYEADLLDVSQNTVQVIKYMTSLKSSGEDYIELDTSKFNKYFNGENVSKLIMAYRNLEKEKKEKYLRLLNAFLTIRELNIFEPQFRDAYFTLSAISKIITNPTTDPGSEELIILACEMANIDLNQINFDKSINSEKLKFLVSEYRNELTHYNFSLPVNYELYFKEYRKMMNLLRKLMIYYLEPSLIEFPYPRDQFHLI